MLQKLLRKSKTSQLNLRDKGKRHMSGKIIKGCVQDASTKLSIGCIPATYQSIIYRSNNQTGFGTSSVRFQQNSQIFSVAPGQYNKEESTLYKWKSQQNFNKKGYGPFISKEKRMWKVNRDTPGPGNYQIKTQFQKINQTQLCSQVKNPFITNETRFKSVKFSTPGPGDYDPKIIAIQNGWKSCFKSEVEKCQYIIENENPGPGQYQIKDKIRKNNGIKINTVTNSHQQKQLNLHEVIQKVMEYRKENIDQYNYEIPDFLPKYEKIKNSPIFMSNMKDRFGNFNKQYEGLKQIVQQKKPGPGAYCIVSTFEKQNKKKNVTSHCFRSQTIRDPFKKNENIMGPNTKQIFKLGKKRFHLNIQKKWV